MRGLGLARQATAEDGVRSHPAIAIPKLYTVQSYFDGTLQQNAILAQPSNSPIVPSTLDEQQYEGWAVGLHPSSQTPVAVECRAEKGGITPTHILKPGEVFRPGMKFIGVRWGLPFGWLGGGLATIVIFATKEADVLWHSDVEVMFHRQRLIIVNAAGLPAVAPYNWPMRFPWPKAAFGSSAVPQPGAPQVAIVRPTKFLFTVRATSLAAPNTLRFLWQASNEFGTDDAGDPILAQTVWTEFDVPSYAINGGAGDLATGYPMFEQNDPPARLAADDGGLVILDMTGGLTGTAVDMVRYGKL